MGYKGWFLKLWQLQVMRRASKSFQLLPVRDRRGEYACERVYRFLDNWMHVTEYLTYDVFRLCNNDDKNPSRRSMNDFWERLRRCPAYDGFSREDHKKVVREYKRKLDVESMKGRFISSAISLGLYMKNVNSDTVIKDCVDGISVLNDNDLEKARKKKIKRIRVFNKDDLEETQGVISSMVDGACLDVSAWGVDDWLEKMMVGSDLDEWGAGDGIA